MYPTGIQQILCLLFSDWDNIGQVFQEEPRASKRGRLLIKRATFDYGLLAFELHGRVRGTKERAKRVDLRVAQCHRRGCTASRRGGRRRRTLAFESESLSRDDGLGRL